MTKLVALAAVVASPTWAAPLQPVSPWHLEYAETQCAAGREFGNPNHPIILIVKPAPNGQTYELIVKQLRVGPPYAQETRGWVDFGTGRIEAWVLRYGDRKMAIQQFRITKEEMAKAKDAQLVTFHVDVGKDAQFALTSMSALLTGLEKCTADLLRYWNSDGEKDGRIATPAKGDLRTIFSSDDFPQEAMSRHQEGSSRFLLLVDEKGKVAGCHVIETSGIPIFDAMGCQVIVTKARFRPALDPHSKPVRSLVTTPVIVWRFG